MGNKIGISNIYGYVVQPHTRHIVFLTVPAPSTGEEGVDVIINISHEHWGRGVLLIITPAPS